LRHCGRSGCSLPSPVSLFIFFNQRRKYRAVTTLRTDMPLKVIGVGFGRTGTDSLREAMEILGMPCYHMISAGHRDEYKYWVKADKQIRETGETTLLKEIFENPKHKWGAAVDFPTCVYYKELLKIYPDAKFVLGIRDPEKWYESAVNTIWHPWGFEWSPFMTISPTIRDLHKLRNSYISRVLKVPYDELNPRDVWNKEKMIKGFNQHIEDVKATIPADKLHIFRVTDGWDGLCAFLGEKVPDVPFPNINDKKEYSKMMLKSNVIGGIAWVVFAGIVGGICYLPFGIKRSFF